MILGRSDSYLERKIAENVHQSGGKLVYLLDDDLLNIPLEISSARHYLQKDVQKNIRRMIELSDAILSPSPLLLKKYAQGKRAIPSFAEKLGARCIPYCHSYDKYRKTLNELEWDIGLAPMPDTPFHACKHYNKFIEYAAAGIVGIFSDEAPYRVIKEKFGWSCLCENTADAWAAEMVSLIENREYREALRKQACEIAAEKLNIETIAQALLSELEAMPITAHEPKVKYRLWYGMVNFFFRAWGFIKKRLRWRGVQ